MIPCVACRAQTRTGDRFCASCGLKITATDHSGMVIEESFKLEERIGAGGMGVIYRARQLSLDKIVAVKLLHDHLVEDETVVHRFHREARAAGSLKHPHTIGVIDFGQTAEGRLYIAMEYLDGPDLGRILDESGPLTTLRAVRIVMQVLEALDEAHSEGIIHRDLKPENIVVTQRRMEPDFVKVLDFGIAKIKDGKRKSDMPFETVAGLVCGTPEYMAPEQVRGEEIDGRTDLYAVGVILFEMLTRRLPFSGGSALSVATRQLTEAPPSLLDIYPDIPRPLDEICQQLLAKNPDDRFPTAMAAHAALKPIMQDLVGAERLTTPGRPGAHRAAPVVGIRSSPFVLEDDHFADERSFVKRWLRAALVLGVVLTGVGVATVVLDSDSAEGPDSGTSSVASAGDVTWPAPPRAGAQKPAAAAVAPVGLVTRREPDPPDPAPRARPILPPTAVVVVLADPAQTRDPEPSVRRDRSERVGRPPAPTLKSAPAPKVVVSGKAEGYEIEGRAAAAAGRWRDAIAAWLVANDLSPKASTQLSVARAYLKLGSKSRACVYFARYANSAGATARPAAQALLKENGCP